MSTIPQFTVSGVTVSLETREKNKLVFVSRCLNTLILFKYFLFQNSVIVLFFKFKGENPTVKSDTNKTHLGVTLIWINIMNTV